MVKYTPAQFSRAVMQTVKTWYKFHGRNGKACKFVEGTCHEDLLISIRYIQQKYRLSECQQDRWLAVQAAMALGHTGDGYMIDIWGGHEFAQIVDLIRTQGPLSYFDRKAFDRWLDC